MSIKEMMTYLLNVYPTLLSHFSYYACIYQLFYHSFAFSTNKMPPKEVVVFGHTPTQNE